MYETMLKIGEGNTAEIFQLDNNRIIKLFKPGYSKESMLHEFQNHQVVSGLLDSTPKLYETVEKNGRFGYIMEKILGTNLAELLLNEQTFTDAIWKTKKTYQRCWRKSTGYRKETLSVTEIFIRTIFWLRRKTGLLSLILPMSAERQRSMILPEPISSWKKQVQSSWQRFIWNR